MPTNNLTVGNLAVGSASLTMPSFNPPVVLSDYVLDSGMSTFHNNCDRIYVCTGPITDFNSVTATAVGFKNFGAGNAFGGLSNGSPSGRVTTSIAFTNGTITTNGLAICWAAVDFAGSHLLAWGVLSGDVQVLAGQLFGLPSFAIHEAGWFAGGGIVTSITANSLASAAAGIIKPAMAGSTLTANPLAAAAAAIGTPVANMRWTLSAFTLASRADAIGAAVLTKNGPYALTASPIASAASKLGVPVLGGIIPPLAHGQQVTLANVGRAGAAAAGAAGYSSTLSVINGNQTYNTTQTFNNVNFTGQVQVTGGTVTFNFCLFNVAPPSASTSSGAALQIYNDGNPSGTVACNWCDLDSGLRGAAGNFETEGFNAGVRTGNFTTDPNSWFNMYRCSFQGYGNGVSLDLWCAGPSSFTECWFGNMTSGAGTHVDCIEVYSSTNITLLRCRMMGDPTLAVDYYSTLINCTDDWGTTPNDNPITVQSCYTNSAATAPIVISYGGGGTYKHNVKLLGNYFGDQSFYGRIIDFETGPSGPLNITYDPVWWAANQAANLPGVILWGTDNLWAPNGEALSSPATAPSGDASAGLPHTAGASIVGDRNIFSGAVWVWTGQILPTSGTTPVITPVNLSIPANPGLDTLVGNVPVTNTPLTAMNIVSGDPNGYFAIYPGSRNLRTSETVTPIPTNNYSLSITATNTSGTSSPATVGISVGAPPFAALSLAAGNAKLPVAIMNGRVGLVLTGIAVNAASIGSPAFSATGGSSWASLDGSLSPGGIIPTVRDNVVGTSNVSASTILNLYVPSGAQRRDKTITNYQPPWSVAGVDYGVGPITTPTKTTDNTSLPAGCSTDTVNNRVIVGPNTVMDGWNFTLGNGGKGWKVEPNGNNITLRNCKIQNISFFAGDGNYPVKWVGDNLLIEYCEFGGGTPGQDTLNSIDWEGDSAGTGTVRYCYFHDLQSSPFNWGNVTTRAVSVVVKYNFFTRCGEGIGDPHVNLGQFGDQVYENFTAEFNCFYQPPSDNGGGEGFQIYGQNSVTGATGLRKAASGQYNTMLCPIIGNGKGTVSYFFDAGLPGRDTQSFFGFAGGGGPGAVFTGSISGTTLTVSGSVQGTIMTNALLTGVGIGGDTGYGILPGTHIVSGSGNTWTLDKPQTVASMTLVGRSGVLANNYFDLNGTNGGLGQGAFHGQETYFYIPNASNWVMRSTVQGSIGVNGAWVDQQNNFHQV